MWQELRAHLREPPARPLRPSRLDAGLAALAIVLAIVEVAVRTQLPFRSVQLVVEIGVGAALLWRRTKPLPALLVAFLLLNLLTVVEIALHLPELGLYSGAFALLYPYALLRHGSGREVVLGLGAVLSAFVGAGIAGDLHGVLEAIGALLFLLFPAALGAAVRFSELARRRDVEHAQLRERQMLARELHDTVAHHVSAIVIQAQGARAVASTRPDAAATALRAIEDEAKRSLTELRALVGALRDDSPAALAPQAHLHTLEELVREAGGRATLERVGDLASLAPAVELALHRIARESLHNALRHARGAAHIDVRCVADGDRVRLTVRDDGASSNTGSHGGAGFGLLGMKERATLLGGTFEAGPSAAGGWLVEVVLPREGRE